MINLKFLNNWKAIKYNFVFFGLQSIHKKGDIQVYLHLLGFTLLFTYKNLKYLEKKEKEKQELKQRVQEYVEGKREDY